MHYMRVLACVTFLFLGNVTVAQKTVTGTVKDAQTGAVLDNAIVSLLRAKDSTLVLRNVNRVTGFSLEAVGGKYLLVTSFVGYRSDTTQLAVTTGKTLSLTIGLIKTENQLDEVVVKSVAPPITIKNDTVVYNASAFKTEDGATVEELLKKLPGVRVDSRGVIRIDGKVVDRIYIDGKAYFIGDPKLATQNFLAEMIDKVETFDEKSHMAKVFGIQDPDAGKAINLRIKPEKKKSPWGKLYSGYGSSARYLGGVTFNCFIPDGLLIAGLKSYNTPSNLPGFSDFDALGLFDLPLRSMNDISKADFNLNKSLTKSLEFTAKAKLSDLSSRNSTMGKRETFLGDSSLLQDRTGTQVYRQKYGEITTAVKHTGDSGRLTIDADLCFKQFNDTRKSKNDYTTRVLTKNHGSYFLNHSTSNSYSDANSFDMSANVAMARKFRKGGGITLNFKFGSSTLRSENFQNNLTQFITGGVQRDQRTVKGEDRSNTNLQLSYAYPIRRGKLMIFNYDMIVTNNYSRQNGFLLDTIVKTYSRTDTVTTNSFRIKNTTQAWGLHFNSDKGKLKYVLGLSMQRIIQQNIDETANRANINQSTASVVPKASISFQLSRSRNIVFSYNGKAKQPTTEQMQPLPNFNNPLLTIIGNPDLKGEFMHALSGSFKSVNNKLGSMLMLNSRLWVTNNRITRASIVDAANGTQTTRFVNTNGNREFSASAEWSSPIGKSNKANIVAESEINLRRDVSFINGLENIRKSVNFRATTGFGYDFNDNISTDFINSLVYGNISYSQNSIGAARFLDQEYDISIRYQSPFGVVMSTQFSCEINGERQALPAMNNILWNASLSKKILRKNAGDIRLSFYDLLNSNTGLSQMANDNYQEVTQAEVMNQFVMLSFVYTFTDLKFK